MNQNLLKLKTKLESADSPRERVDILNSLAIVVRESDPQQGLEYATEARDLAKKDSYEIGLANSLLRIGQLNSRLGNLGQALSQVKKALATYESVADNDPELYIAILLTLSVLFSNLGNESDGLEHGLKALRICQENGLQDLEATVLSNLGAIYNSMGDYTQELKIYEQAFKIHKEANHSVGKATILNNMAMAYRSLGQLPEALEKGEQALDVIKGIDASVMLEACVVCTLGEIHLDMGQHNEAIDHLQRGMDLARDAGFREFEMCALLGIGKALLAQGKADLALPQLQQALTIANDCGFKAERADCQRVLAEVFKQLGDLESALKCYEELSATQQELSSEEMAKKIANLRVVHETETAQKETEIYRLQTVDLGSRNVALDAYAHSVAHDLKSPLTAIMGLSELLRDRPEMPVERRRDLANLIYKGSCNMESIIDSLLLLASVRETEEVATTILDMAQIVTDTLQTISLFTKERNAEITFPAKFPAAVGYAPWVQEVWANYITNAIKYGGSPPQIELDAKTHEDGFVRFWVKDNGAGLSPKLQERLFIPFEQLHETNTEGHGLGLSIVKRIIDKLGGEVAAVSKEGEGSTFIFTLPAAG